METTKKDKAAARAKRDEVRGRSVWNMRDPNRYYRDQIAAALDRFADRVPPQQNTVTGVIKHILVANIDAILDAHLPPAIDKK